MNPPSISLARLCWLAAFASLIGAWIARGATVFAEANDPTIPMMSDFYNFTFSRFEPMALYFLAGLFAVLGFTLRRAKAPAMQTIPLLNAHSLALVVALTVLVATNIGRFTVHQNFDLSIDEYLNDFEAQILDRHHVVAEVPAPWRDHAYALSVPYQNYNATTGCWASGFLPGFAFLNFIFTKMDLDWALSPILAAGSLLMLAQLARRIFPAQPILAANIAVLLLASSPQFLALALTKFAWTAHLGGSLVWLWLFTHPRRIPFLLTPIFGALLIGLHQPHVHPLIAAPFVLRLLRDARWKDFTWFSVVYVAGALAWYQVYVMLRPTAFASGSELNNFISSGSSFGVLATLSVIFASFHATTLLAWTSPVLVPLLVMVASTWKQQPAVVRDGVCAAILTYVFYLCFPHPQGHGWGYRYIHVAYGFLALAGTSGALMLCRDGQALLVSRAIAVSLAFTVFFQVPYRANEIRAMVRPLAQTSNYIARQKTDFVVIKTTEFWYSWDLIRNDPWLEKKPLIFNEDRMTPEQRADLPHHGTVTYIGAEQVAPFGVIVSDPAKKRQ